MRKAQVHLFSGARPLRLLFKQPGGAFVCPVSALRELRLAFVWELTASAQARRCLTFTTYFLSSTRKMESLYLNLLLLLLLLNSLLAAFEFSLRGSSPYTNTDETNKNKYT
jgi:hypothetical protein